MFVALLLLLLLLVIMIISNIYIYLCLGITELYEASLCLFWIRTGKKKNIAEYCNPRRKIEGKITHHVPKHDDLEVSDKIW